MARGDSHEWMWSQAVELLARAERMHDQLFQPNQGRSEPAWSPPVDVIETEREVLILVALPGVAPEAVDAVIEGGTLVIAGRRVLPKALRTAVIHRIELPQGRFERRIRLPAGVYDTVERSAQDGCLVISLGKARS